MITIRTARGKDEPVLAEIDQRTWTSVVSPAPAPPPGTPFFDEDARPENFLVADDGGTVAGYCMSGSPRGSASPPTGTCS